MASLDKKICTLCYDDDGASTEAVVWCTDCEVFLCKDCGKHHKRSRTSEDHKTMSSTEYHKLPQFMREISSLKTGNPKVPYLKKFKYTTSRNLRQEFLVHERRNPEIQSLKTPIPKSPKRSCPSL